MNPKDRQRISYLEGKVQALESILKEIVERQSLPFDVESIERGAREQRPGLDAPSFDTKRGIGHAFHVVFQKQLDLDSKTDSWKENWRDGAIYLATGRSEEESLEYIRTMPKAVLAILRRALEDLKESKGDE